MKELVLGGRAVVIGRGSLEYLKCQPAKRVFVVTGGRSMFANGTIAKIQELFAGRRAETYIYSGIKQNPDTQAVLDGVRCMREFMPDLLVAVGGGSPLDAAKVMGIMYEYPELDFETILDSGLPQERKKLRFAAVPSTSGTGSEVTKAAVITFERLKLKIGLKTPAFIPDIAILDAELTMSMPDNVVAETGMDALTHAVECYINDGLDDFTESLARGAVEGIIEYLPLSYKDRTLASREKMHNYQCIAGLAFTNVGLGMAHGIAHAVGGMFDIGHGLINAIALPHVLKYNSRAERVQRKLRKLATSLGESDFVETVRRLNDCLNIPVSLKDAGISERQFKENLPLLIDNSLKGSTKANPVEVSRQDVELVLNNMFYGNKL